MIAVSFDIAALEKSLGEAIVEIEQRLSSMVQTFTYKVALSAISKTPIGSVDEGTARYKQYYARRKEELGLSAIEGFARGSWSVDNVLNQTSMTNTEGYYGMSAGQDAAEKIFFDDLSKYRLGDSLYITNTGPYIDKLQDNWSAQTEELGIMEPTIEDVRNIYQHNLADYYNA